MNDYQAMAWAIEVIERHWREAGDPDANEQLDAIYTFMLAVSSKLHEIAPELN